MNIDYFKRTFKFSPESNTPLYEQLAAYIKIQIQAGVLKPGDKMITEHKLCDILNVSRTTIRQALDRLVEEGLLIRYRGKGSYIAEQKLKRNINYLYNFTENIRDAGATPSSIVLENRVIDVDENIASRLQLPSGQTKAFMLKRLRCADGEPIMHDTTYIPYYLCNGIEDNDFSTASLYNILANCYNLQPYHAVEIIESILIDKEHAKLLKTKPKEPGFKIDRISHLESGYVFEYTTSVSRADKCVFVLDLYRSGNTNKNAVEIQRKINL